MRASTTIWRAAIIWPGGFTTCGSGASRRDAFKGAVASKGEVPQDAKRALRGVFDTLRGAPLGRRIGRVERAGHTLKLWLGCR